MARVLVVLGVIGLGQYVYFQLTPLGYKYEYYTYNMPGIPYDMIGVNVTRDWTVGLVGLIIGVVLLGVGLYRLRQYKAH